MTDDRERKTPSWRHVLTIAGLLGIVTLSGRCRDRTDAQTPGAPAPAAGTDRLQVLLTCLTLVTGVAALPVAFTQGRPASAILMLAAVLAGLGVVFVRTWRRGGRAHGGRWAAGVTAVLVVAGTATVIAIPAGRSFLVYKTLGFHDPRHAAKLGQITIADSAARFRVQAPIRSVGADAQQLTDVSVSLDWNANVTMACDSGTITYRLRDRLAVGRTGHAGRTAVDVGSGGLKNHWIPATGSLHEFCVSGRLDLTFNSGVTIEKQARLTLYIDIPKVMKATYLRVANPDGTGLEKSGSLVSHVDIPDPIDAEHPGRARNGYLTITLRATTSSGTRLSACRTVYGIDVTGSEKARPGC